MTQTHGCSKCGNTSVVYDYGSKMILCEKCKAPAKDFKPIPLKVRKKPKG